MMVDISKATPRPWRITKSRSMSNQIEGNTGQPRFDDDDGYRTVATFQSAGSFPSAIEEDENRTANAALIVAAVNSYDQHKAEREALLTALRKIAHPTHWALSAPLDSAGANHYAQICDEMQRLAKEALAALDAARTGEA